MLTLNELESRTVAVSVLIDWRFSPFPEWSPLGEAVKTAAVGMAARLEKPGQMTIDQPFLAHTPWGAVDEPGVPAETFKVYVGPTPPGTLGTGGMVSYSAGELLPRSPGMTLGINSDPSAWLAYHLPTVVKHEVVHGLTGAGHVGGEPRALMAPGLQLGTVAAITPPDVALIRQTGWEVYSTDTDLVIKAYNGMWGNGGFALLSAREAGLLYERGAFTDFEVLLAYTAVLK